MIPASVAARVAVDWFNTNIKGAVIFKSVERRWTAELPNFDSKEALLFHLKNFVEVAEIEEVEGNPSGIIVEQFPEYTSIALGKGRHAEERQAREEQEAEEAKAERDAMAIVRRQHNIQRLRETVPEDEYGYPEIESIRHWSEPAIRDAASRLGIPVTTRDETTYAIAQTLFPEEVAA